MAERIKELERQRNLELDDYMESYLKVEAQLTALQDAVREMLYCLPEDILGHYKTLRSMLPDEQEGGE
jgi:mRNA-degrading endonuclease HigB of HigAB toxin-antitoxin module